MFAAGVCRPGSTTRELPPNASTTFLLADLAKSHPSQLLQLKPLHRQSLSSTVLTQASSSTAPISTHPLTAFSVSRTSAVETTSPTKATTSTTSAGPPPIPTFNVIASGGGPAADTRLSASCRASSITFDYEAGDASAQFFSIDLEIGRLKTSRLGTYVCATFDENGQPAGAAYLVNCIQQNIDVGGDYIAYLRCDLNQGKITCTTHYALEELQ